MLDKYLSCSTLVQYSTFGYVLVMRTSFFLVIDIGNRYINAFGVYQDFYVREYLNNYTPSDIGYMRSYFNYIFCSLIASRWIGGIQIFLNFSLGILTGRLFDRGYLCVRLVFMTPTRLIMYPTVIIS